MEKLLRIKAHCDDDGEYSTYVDNISVEEVDFAKLLSEKNHFDLYLNHKLVRIDATKNIPKEAQEYLKTQGWVHSQLTKKREEKKILEQEYYILDENGQEQFFIRKTKFHKVDIDQLSQDDIDQLTNGAKIVQVVQPQSVMNPQQYEKLKTAKSLKKVALEKKKLAAEKKKEKLKQSEIEKARKILEEAGELPNSAQ